jgi:Tol biopolymer transport system component
MEVTKVGQGLSIAKPEGLRPLPRNLQRGLRAALALTLLLGTAQGARAGQVELVSRVAADEVSDTASSLLSTITSPPPYPVSVSANGRYVTFISSATNLVPGQGENTGFSSYAFLRDRVAGTTVLVSHSAAAPTAPTNLPADTALGSPDGRYVAWSSRATDVVAGQTGGGVEPPVNVFLFDSVSGTNQLLGPGNWVDAFSKDGRFLLYGGANVFLYDLTARTVTTLPIPGNSDVSISRDGHFIAFDKEVSGFSRVLIFDRLAGTTEDLGAGGLPLLSDDGRYVAYQSGASNNVPGQVDGNNSTDAFLYDRVTRTTVLASRSLASPLQAGNRALPGQQIALSPDGRYVAFASTARDMVQGQPDDSLLNILLFDRTTGTVKLVAQVFPLHVFLTFLNDIPVFSGDGRSLAFVSSVSLVPGQASAGNRNLFLYDLSSGRTTLVSALPFGSTVLPVDHPYMPLISDDGRTVVFSSGASDLVPGLRDFNEAEDVFAYTVPTGAIEAITLSATASATPTRHSAASAISPDGHWIAYESNAAHLVSGQVDHQERAFDGTTDVFLYDTVARSSLLVSHVNGSPATTGNDWAAGPVLNADGRYVAFTSSNNLTTGLLTSPSVYLFDRIAGTSVLVSHDPNVITEDVGDHSAARAISADGRYVAFTSDAPGLVAGQADNRAKPQIFLYDRITGLVTLVSHSTAGPQHVGDGESYFPAFSADGRYLAFGSNATNLVQGQTGIGGNVFLYDQITGVTTLVTHEKTSTTAAAGFRAFALSADGRSIAFTSNRPDLAANATGTDAVSLYLYDRVTGTNTWLVSMPLLSLPVPRSFDQPIAISGDGRVIAFESPGALVPGQTGPTDNDQLYLYDRIANTLILASRAGGSATTGIEGGTSDPALSADGRYAVYLGDYPKDTITPASPNVYVFDRAQGTTVLASPSRTSAATGAGGSSLPLINADGAIVAFTSASADLVEGDFNHEETDAFLFRTGITPPPPPPPPPPGPVTLPACILLDTHRRADRPALHSNVQRTVQAQGRCGVPATAKQVVAKVTVQQGTGTGTLSLYPGGSTTLAGSLSFTKNQTRSAAFTLTLGPKGTFVLLPSVAKKGTVQAIVEIDGYFP